MTKRKMFFVHLGIVVGGFFFLLLLLSLLNLTLSWWQVIIYFLCGFPLIGSFRAAFPRKFKLSLKEAEYKSQFDSLPSSDNFVIVKNSPPKPPIVDSFYSEAGRELLERTVVSLHSFYSDSDSLQEERYALVQVPDFAYNKPESRFIQEYISFLESKGYKVRFSGYSFVRIYFPVVEES